MLLTATNFVGSIAAVVVAVTPVVTANALAAGAQEVCGGVAHCEVR